MSTPLKSYVFSYRVLIGENGQIFDPNIGYEQFLNRAKILSQNNLLSFVVTTDIADFYSRIYHHRLENALQSATRGYAFKFSNLHLARVLKFLMKSRQSLKSLPSLVFTN